MLVGDELVIRGGDQLRCDGRRRISIYMPSWAMCNGPSADLPGYRFSDARRNIQRRLLQRVSVSVIYEILSGRVGILLPQLLRCLCHVLELLDLMIRLI